MEKKIRGDKVKWGIIGVGDVCEVKSAPAMQKVKGSELVAVMRRNGEKDQMTIIGSKGQIRVPFFGEPKIIIEKSNMVTEVLEFELPCHIQQPLIEMVVNDLLGKGTCPSTGESAIRTNWVMEEMTKNYYQN